MKIIRNGRQYTADRSDVKYVDQSDNRMRLYSDEREAYLKVKSALALATQFLPRLKRVGKTNKSWKKLSGAVSLLASGIAEYTKKCSLEQITSMQNEWRLQKVVVSHSASAEMVNIEQRKLHKVVTAAQEAKCTNCLECIDKSMWQKCEWAKLFDTLDCQIDELKSEAICPYYLRGE